MLEYFHGIGVTVQSLIDLGIENFRSAGMPGEDTPAVIGGKRGCQPDVGGQALPDFGPSEVHSLGAQFMADVLKHRGQHGNIQMGLNGVVLVVINRPHAEVAFHGTKRILHVRKRGIHPDYAAKLMTEVVGSGLDTMS